MGSHQRFQRFTVRRQNNHRIGRPARASRLPLSASDSSCHGAADSTPVLLSESSLAQTTFVPSRKAESQLPLGGTRKMFYSYCVTNLRKDFINHVRFLSWSTIPTTFQGLGMGLRATKDVESRFDRYVQALVGVIGHQDRAGPMRDYCLGLVMPGERKSVEPMAAITAPERTAAQHQSL